MVLASWPAQPPCASAAEQDALGRAKALYTSAAYDEALALLSQLDEPSPADAVEVNQYRAFCLLALGRGDDARKVIQDRSSRRTRRFSRRKRRVAAGCRPRFATCGGACSPRSSGSPTRTPRPPSSARTSSSRTAGSQGVIALLDDDDAKGSGELGDLRILSNGFLDLIKTMAPAAPMPVATSPLPQL